jgi:ribosomal protein S1
MEVSTVKKLIALPLALVFALGMAGLAAAQEKKPEDTKKPEMKSDAKMEKKAEKKAATKTANGTVKSATADSVVVAGKDKGKEAEWTFAVDPKTSIKKGGKAITAADIKTGDSVQVKYTEADGKAMAQSVMVKAPAASAKKMDDKKMDAKPAAPAAEKK